MRHWLAGLASLCALMLPVSSMGQVTQPLETMPGYLIVIGKTTDRAKIGGYAAALGPIYASHNAYYAAIGGAGRGVTWLEGPIRDRSLVLARFPSRQAIDAFWWGEPYRAAIRKRDNAGVFSVIAVPADTSFVAEGADKGYLVVMTALKDASPQQAQASAIAAQSLRESVDASGGTLLSSSAADRFTSLEGDSLFDRVVIAAWPSQASRDAYLVSRPARRAARLRSGLGLSVVVSANGVPRNQAPPAAAPTR